MRREGFASEIIEAPRCVTKTSETEDYDAFIGRIMYNRLAVAVKINDLTDNLDVRRLPSITEKDMCRLNQYLKAYRKLVAVKNQ